MRLASLLLLNILSVLASAQVAPCPSGEEVYIPDDGLRRTISLTLYARSEAYEKYGVAGWVYSAEHPITCQDMLSITGLDAHLRNIDNLQGLQFAANLETLNLEDNNVVDISPLAQLTKLRGLDLGGNAISDLSPLVGMASLERLSMHSNRANPRDFEPLTHLSQLKYLSLRTQARDTTGLEHLAKLTKLEHVYIRKDGVFDISYVATSDELREVVIGAEQVLNVESLLVLPNLERLSLSVCVRFADESLLRAVDNLRESVSEVELRLIEDYSRFDRPSIPLCGY